MIASHGRWKFESRLPWSLVAVFVFLSLFLLGGGYYYYAVQKNGILEAQQYQLSAVSELKVHEIAHWYEEHIGQAETIRHNSSFAGEVRSLFRNPTDACRKGVGEYLASLAKDGGYRDVSLYDTALELHDSKPSGNKKLGASERVSLSNALASKEIVVSDFDRDFISDSPHLSMYVPLLSDTSPVGALLLEFDLSEVNLAFGSSWPTPSITAEALLVRRDQDSVVYLNEVRHRVHSTLSLKFALADSSLPAVMAVLGKTGIVHGMDYRQVPVLASIRPVPRTPWFLVVKEDMDEIVGPIRVQGWLAASLSLLLIALLGVSIGYVWRHRRSEFYRRQLALEEERSALKLHFEYLTKYANDAILLTDEFGMIREANERSASYYGYSYEELIGRSIGSLLVNLEVDLDAIKSSSGEQGLVFESVHKNRNGSTFPVEASTRELIIDGRRFHQTIVRDITERRRTEDQLRETEEKFRTLFETMNEGVAIHEFVYDAAGQPSDYRILSVNAAFETNTGLSAGSVNSQLASVAYGAIEPPYMDVYVDVARSGIAQTFETYFPPLQKYFRITAYALGSARFATVFEDITERHNSAEALRASEERFRSIIEGSAAAYFRIGVDGRYQYVNGAWLRMHDYESASDVIGRPFALTQVSEDLRDAESMFEAVLNGEVIPDGEFSRRRKDGSIGYHSLSIQPIRSRGSIVAVEGFLIDTSEKKKVDEELRDSESRFRSVTQSASDAIIAADEGGIITLWNSGATKIFGYDETEMIGQSLLHLMPERYREDHKRGMAALVATGVQHVIGKTVELAGLRRDGTEFPLELSLNFWKAGRETNFSAIIRDVEERSKSEAAIRASEIRFRSVWERSVDGMRLTDDLGRIIGVNDAYCRLVHMSREELVGHVFSKTYKDTPGRDGIELYQERFASGNIVPMLCVRTVLWNEIEVDVEIANSFIEFEPGNKMLLSIFRDVTERKKAEERLEAERTLLRTILDAIPDEIAVKDTDRRFALVNPVTVRAFRRTLYDEIIGKREEDLALTIYADYSRDEDLKILSGEVDSINRTACKSDSATGEIQRALMISKIPLKDGAGNTIGLVGVNRDITEIKRAQELLEKERTLLRVLLENIPDEICLKDTQHRFIVANASSAQSLGLKSADEMIGKVDADLISKELALIHLAEEEQILDTGQPLLNAERYALDQQTGELLRCVLTSKVPVRDSTGRTVGILVVNRDITERKKAEQAIQASEEKFRLLFEESKDVIYMSSPEGRLLDLNRAGVELFGYDSREEMLKLNISESYTDSRRREEFHRQMNADGFVKDFEETLRTKNGAILSVLETASAVRDRTGTVVMYRGIMRDVTKQHELERQVLHSQKMESLGLLAGGVAHDFNNLLLAMLGNTSMALKRLQDDHPAHANIVKAENAAQRASQITRQLLAYSGRGKFDVKPLDINVVIRDNINLLGVAIPKNVRLLLNLSPDIREIEADAGQIQQIVMNLIINASEAIGAQQGTIECRSWVETVEAADASQWVVFDQSSVPGDFVMFEISDDGTGMEPETLKNIFDPFFTTKFTGRGLGLPAVLGIVRGHRGGLQVSSALGKGTTFRLAFPVGHFASREGTKKDKPAKKPAPTGCILAIDDEEAVRAVLADIFVDNGIKPILAENGQQGLELYREYQNDISLVILDLSMPGLSGLDTCKGLLEINPEVKVVLTSGYAEEEAIHGFDDLSIAGFIQKPYKWDKLVDLLYDFLGQRVERS